MKTHKHLAQVFFLILVLLFTLPVASTVQEPLQVEAASTKLSKSKISVKEGKTTVLTVKNPTQKVKWSTSNKKVVKIVKKSGTKQSKVTLQGIKKGTATITAKVGTKKLKAKVTVNHVHKWLGYATCTTPDTCQTCGATRGTALGHNWTTATCLAVSTCQRCGITTGGLGAHSWDDDNICSVCNTLNMPELLQMQITNAAQNPGDGVKIAVRNTGRQEVRLTSKSANMPFPAVLNMNGREINVYLYDTSSGGWYTSYQILTNTINDNLVFCIESWNKDDYFTIPFNASIVFDLSYYNKRTHRFDEYKVTVTPSGECSYQKY